MSPYSVHISDLEMPGQGLRTARGSLSGLHKCLSENLEAWEGIGKECRILRNWTSCLIPHTALDVNEAKPAGKSCF